MITIIIGLIATAILVVATYFVFDFGTSLENIYTGISISLSAFLACVALLTYCWAWVVPKYLGIYT